MKTNKLNRVAAADRDLAQVLEPLASYICAAEHPRVALASALAALRKEVETTYDVALAQCGMFAQSCSL